MGQIIGRAAKPDACNLRSLSSYGIPAAGQHILVSTDNSAMQNGQGIFDAYVVGDGKTAATALLLKKITPVKVTDINWADLAISDESGAIIMYLSDGHIVTKNFNSANSLKLKDDTTNDFSICDEVGYEVLRVENGHIITKEFDSRNVGESPRFGIGKFAGKTLGVIGDSISTFAGSLPSDIAGYDGATYATYQPTSAMPTIDLMWWYKVAEALGMDTSKIANCSWSGSKVTGNSGATSSAVSGCSTRRVNDLAAYGFVPDIIVCYISCNDWANEVAVGTWSVSDSVPSEGVLSTLREAYAMLLYKLHTTYPTSRIFCCTITDDRNRDEAVGYPSSNGNGVTTYQWNENIKEIASAFGCDVIDLHSCGINLFNLSTYSVDGLHPNALGHELIANKVISELLTKF